MVVLPVFQDRSARYEYDIELAGVVYHLKFAWNAREEAWYMDIQDQDEVDILVGIKLVINYRLLLQYRALDVPDGDFICWDLEQNPVAGGITFDNLGTRYQLLFFTTAEIEAGAVIGT